MITMEAAGLALSIAKGIIKMTGRIDRLMAEKEATTGDFILPMPVVSDGPGGIEMVENLKKLLADTEGATPNPITLDRNELNTFLDEDTPKPETVLNLYTRFFPESAQFSFINPDDQFFKELKLRFPTLDLEDESTRYAAFAIASGRDEQQIGYPLRVALIVTDVFAEFGAQNTAMFLHDEKIRPIVQSLLVRFSEPDLGSYSMWSPLLRHALGSTLNGVLDSREAWQGENEWMNAVLNALVSSRKENGEDYLLGLMYGTGYRLLISRGLSEAATILGDETAGLFEKVVSDILSAAAPLVKEDTKDFGPFFQDHWGDLFRAGLRSLEKYGPTILKDESPILKKTLMAMISALTDTQGTHLLSNETVFNLTDAVISAVASKENLLTEDIEEPWLKELINSVIQTVGDQGTRRSLSKEGLEGMVNRTLNVFAEHPELIIEKPGLLQELVRNVLENVSGHDSLKVNAIATAAVEGALDAVAENPALIRTPYAEIIADFAGKMANKVAAETITGIQAADIIAVTAEAIMLNPILFIEVENKLSDIIVDAVLNAYEEVGTNILYGSILVVVIDELLGKIARYGRSLLDEGSPEDLKDWLTALLTAGIERARVELGRNIDLVTLPIILAELPMAVSRVDLVEIDSEDPEFIKIFIDLADRAAG